MSASKSSQDKSKDIKDDDGDSKMDTSVDKDKMTDELNLDSMTKSDKLAEVKDRMQTAEYKDAFDKAEPFLIEESKEYMKEFKNMMTSEGQLELKQQYDSLVDNFTGEKKDLLLLLSRKSISVESKAEKEKKEKENKRSAIQCDWCKKGITLFDANENGLLGLDEVKIVFKRESHAVPYMKDSLDICSNCVKIPQVVKLIMDLKTSGIYIVSKTIDAYADLFINTICNTLVGLGDLTANQIRKFTKVVHDSRASVADVSLKWWTMKQEARKHNGDRIMFDLKIPIMWWLINLATMANNVTIYDVTPKDAVVAENGVPLPPLPPAPPAPPAPHMAHPLVAPDAPAVAPVPIAGHAGNGGNDGVQEQKVPVNICLEMDDSFNVQIKKIPIMDKTADVAAEEASAMSNNPMQEKLDVWPALLNEVKLCLEDLPLGLMETIYYSWTDLLLAFADKPEVMMDKVMKTMSTADPIEIDLLDLTGYIARL